MNPLDITIIIILGYCVTRGLFRGLIKELTAIIALFIGFHAAYNYYPLLSKQLAVWAPNFQYLKITSFLIIFFVVVIIVNLIGMIIKYIINFVFLGWIDKIFGVIFGVLKAGLIVVILAAIITAFIPKGSIFLSESLIFPHLSQASKQLVKLIPENMKSNLEVMIKELNKK
ncbi:MAG: CvpA family protein [Deltaproteobacteria bacterium]|nr:CvpA family protein [Deltaproteobacteria bacterium]